NGVEALQELEKQGGDVDLVVSDVVMPEMDGPTLMKELKKRKPDIKIIFVSGYAEDAFDKSLPDPTQFNFLAKPFTLKQLVKVVKETMAGRGSCRGQPAHGYSAAHVRSLPCRHERARATERRQIRGDGARASDRQRGVAAFPRPHRGRRHLARQRHVRPAPPRRLHGAGGKELRPTDRGAGAIAADMRGAGTFGRRAHSCLGYRFRNGRIACRRDRKATDGRGRGARRQARRALEREPQGCLAADGGEHERAAIE